LQNYNQREQKQYKSVMRENPADGNFGAYKQYDKKKRLDCRDRRGINDKNQY
jgi:hypothetical protein